MMAFTADTRPQAMGNLIVITGTVANGDTSTDLSDYMSEILMAMVNPNGGGGGAPQETIVITGTTVTHGDPGTALGGKLFAIGKR